LLEDIDLAGAHGILVNVTAGASLSIGEFQEVGMTVKAFAAEDATVVVGTVIDPDMENEIRVTVVATGLGRPALSIVKPEPPVRVTRVYAGEPNYSALEKPTVQRQRAAASVDGPAVARPLEEMLDIPAFLRRQAD
jgi:cell division protein FtsZ